MKWREWRRKRRYLEEKMSEREVVDELVEYMVYCCAARGDRETTIASKLVAVSFF